MTEGDMAYLTPEARARVEIDRMLAAAGWAVQDAVAVNLTASRGVAVLEVVMKPPHGRADYLLFLDGHAAGWWRRSRRLAKRLLGSRLLHRSDRQVPVACSQI